jgi:hypothetical protein
MITSLTVVCSIAGAIFSVAAFPAGEDGAPDRAAAPVAKSAAQGPDRAAAASAMLPASMAAAARESLRTAFWAAARGPTLAAAQPSAEKRASVVFSEDRRAERLARALTTRSRSSSSGMRARAAKAREREIGGVVGRGGRG